MINKFFRLILDILLLDFYKNGTLNTLLMLNTISVYINYFM